MAHLSITPPIHYAGTPVILLGTTNGDGTPNLAPASSFWALGQMLVIGMETLGQTVANVRERPELTVNFPSPDLWRNVEAIANTTGVNPVPAEKSRDYSYVPDKFAAAQLTPEPSVDITPPRVAECDLQLETRVRRVTTGVEDFYAMVEAEVVQTHAAEHIVIPGTHHINPHTWRPMIYSYRHYFGLGEDHGHRPNSPAV